MQNLLSAKPSPSPSVMKTTEVSDRGPLSETSVVFINKNFVYVYIAIYIYITITITINYYIY